MRSAAGFRRSISTARKRVSKYFSVRTASVATAGRAGSPARVTATTDGALLAAARRTAPLRLSEVVTAAPVPLRVERGKGLGVCGRASSSG